MKRTGLLFLLCGIFYSAIAQPTTAAPDPTCPAADVISMFSGVYTDVTVDTWRTDWSVADYSELPIVGNNTKRYENLSFVGIETVGPNLIDASGMTHFHLDYWTPDMTQLRIKLVDFGANQVYGDGTGNPGGDDSEHEVTISSPTLGQWVSLAIPLANFTGLNATTNLAQLILAGQPAGSGTLYIDNVYYSNGCGPTETSCVTFSVNMNNYAGAFTTVYLSGDFNTWSGTATPMSDEDGDGVWTVTVELEHGAQEYRFTLDNLAVEETLPAGSACTIMNGGQNNRTITVSGPNDVCYTWESCDACLCPVLIWSDEFDGTSLDLTKWTPQIGDGCDIGLCGWGNNELEYYRAENAEVSGGTLKIIAKQETFSGRNYTSARLRSINQGDWVYGRFEASIKLPTGQGIWPAFWMLPTDNVYGGWPQSGEIDIMELVGHEPDVTHGTIHYGEPWPNNSFSGSSYQLVCDIFNDDFHEFAIEWGPNEIRWYMDDYLFFTRTPADIAPYWPFDQKFHFLLNVAVGGNWPGAPNGTTMFPQTMEVDYVRVYKGNFAYLTGNTTVNNQASGEVYAVMGSAAGSAYTWTVPMGATIISGQGTNTITVDWGGTTSGGTITVVEMNGCSTNTMELKVLVDIERVDVLDCVLEDFDNDALITYSNSSGTYQDNTANPTMGNPINSSVLVGQYTRNPAEQYDNLQYTTTAITDASEFVNGSKTFYIDIFTTAPVGTTIILQLENSATAMPANYPTGRHSRYQVTTSVQNAWERLVFSYVNRPDGATSDTGVDRLVF